MKFGVTLLLLVVVVVALVGVALAEDVLYSDEPLILPRRSTDLSEDQDLDSDPFLFRRRRDADLSYSDSPFLFRRRRDADDFDLSKEDADFAYDPEGVDVYRRRRALPDGAALYRKRRDLPAFPDEHLLQVVDEDLFGAKTDSDFKKPVRRDTSADDDLPDESPFLFRKRRDVLDPGFDSTIPYYRRRRDLPDGAALYRKRRDLPDFPHLLQVVDEELNSPQDSDYKKPVRRDTSADEDLPDVSPFLFRKRRDLPDGAAFYKY